ncbi:DNA polymerase IV [Candidatus Uhrbacteria bacterium]|nr:DNA polymerase IV [Candidatus Uhrbacteria bacterium]
MNSYFASVEQQANPFLRGKPIGITGKHKEHSIIATASIEARRKGVKTAMSTYEAKRVCPSIILYPCDPKKYSYITHQFNKIFRAYADCAEQFSIDESFLEITKAATDYFGAVCLAQTIRQRIKEECGEYITCSIGIAQNKLMAKLCSEQVKPNGLTVVQPKNVLSFLDSCQLKDVCGIGHRTEERLNAIGIYTFEQLRKFPLENLTREFKSYGYWLNEASYGRDNSPVVDTIEDPKSIGHSCTLTENTEDEKEMKRCLLELSDRVAWRLRKKGFVARCVRVCIRYFDFTEFVQQRKFIEPTNNGLTLFQTAWQIGNKWRDKAKPVRLLGITASNLTKGKGYQSLFKKERKIRSLQNSLDNLQNRYGSKVWSRASLLYPPNTPSATCS